MLKPLVPVAGVTLVERVLTSLAEAAPSEVVIIINASASEVRDHVSACPWPFRLHWIVETTASSMHSFLRIIERLNADGDDGPFLISTVDTVAAPGVFEKFAGMTRLLDADVTLAVTAPTDDDQPLLVAVGPDSRVTAIGAAAAGAPWATAGFYSVRASVLREADEARREGVSSLRQFFGRLQQRGFQLAAIPVAGGIDVDRPADVRAAEQFLKQVGA
jgi:NDP-sugar pyrophosphorylase family protein